MNPNQTVYTGADLDLGDALTVTRTRLSTGVSLFYAKPEGRDGDLVCSAAIGATVDWLGVARETLVGGRLVDLLEVIDLQSHWPSVLAALGGERRSRVHTFRDGLVPGRGRLVYQANPHAGESMGVVVTIGALSLRLAVSNH